MDPCHNAIGLCRKCSVCGDGRGDISVLFSSKDGDLGCSVQLVDTVLICPYFEMLTSYCPETVCQDGLHFAVGHGLYKLLLQTASFAQVDSTSFPLNHGGKNIHWRVTDDLFLRRNSSCLTYLQRFYSLLLTKSYAGWTGN